MKTERTRWGCVARGVLEAASRLWLAMLAELMPKGQASGFLILEKQWQGLLSICRPTLCMAQVNGPAWPKYSQSIQQLKTGAFGESVYGLRGGAETSWRPRNDRVKQP